jgi:hypothetical protein
VAAEIQFSSPRSRELIETARRFSVCSSVLALIAGPVWIVLAAYSYHDHNYDYAAQWLFLAGSFVTMATLRPNFKVAPKFEDRIPFSTAILGLITAALIVFGVLELRSSPLVGLFLLSLSLVMISALSHKVSVDKIRRAVGIQTIGVSRLDIALHEIQNPTGFGSLKSKIHRHVDQEAHLGVETDGRFLDAWHALQRVGSTDYPKSDGDFRCAVIDVYLDGRHSVADVLAASAQNGFASTCELSG